ncbi:MAG: hypothetical protein ACI8UO_006688 [Verrucomicrobiales bacterium]
MARANDWESAPILARPSFSESFGALKSVLSKVDADSATDSVSKALIWAEIFQSCEFFTVGDIATAHAVTPGRIRQIRKKSSSRRTKTTSFYTEARIRKVRLYVKGLPDDLDLD